MLRCVVVLARTPPIPHQQNVHKLVLLRKDVEPKDLDETSTLSAAVRGQHVQDAAALWVHPFWRVERTQNEDDKRSNMKMSFWEVDGHDVKVPCMVNTKKVDKDAALVLYTPKERAGGVKRADFPATKNNSKKQR
jgi:hypothetical protein